MLNNLLFLARAQASAPYWKINRKFAPTCQNGEAFSGGLPL